MLWLMIFLHVILAQRASVEGITVRKPGCRSKCGNVSVPFPFGIDPGCFLEGFSLICQHNATDGTYKLLSNNLEFAEIMLSTSQVRMLNNISWQCYDSITRTIRHATWPLNFSQTPFTISSIHNKLVSIGCDTLTYNTMMDYKNNKYRTGCVSVCYAQESVTNGTCSGIGCCTTPIPPGISFANISFDKDFNSSTVSEFRRCSYAALMDVDNFFFKTAYVSSAYDDYYSDVSKRRAYILMDWSISNENREVARIMENYACVSRNSVCINQTAVPGYSCNCSEGYEGNPFLVDGCQGLNFFPIFIDERLYLMHC